MLDEEREGVLEEVIRTLLKGNSFECIPETFVSFLELLREGLV